jgi:hypothetical protein
MASTTPSGNPSQSPVVAQLSTLRRKGAEVFSDSAFSSSNPFDPDDFELEGQAFSSSPTVEEDNDVHSTSLSNDTAPASPRMSTLKRKTNELFGSSNPFDVDEDEFEESSQSVRPSTLRRKTDELFSDKVYSSNAFDPNESEFDEFSPTRTVRGTPFPTLQISSRKLAGAAVSAVSVEGLPSRHTEEQTSATASLSQANLEVPPNTPLVSPGLNTFKRESAKLFSDSDIWEDEDEFVAKLETLRINPTRRIRGNLFKSMRASPLRSVFDAPEPSRVTSKNGGSHTSKVEDQEDGAAKSIWDADDDEFDRWPDKDDLAATVKSFATQRGTFKGFKHTTASLHVDKSEVFVPIRGGSMTEQEHDDFMHELLDKNCGNPDGIDAHDQVMQQFYQREIKLLPASNPAGHPHIIGVKAYMGDEDRIVQNARPRLADAVATVLHLTHPKCLADFLDPKVKIFEWCRSKHCVLIRREGNEVIVGTYRNYGTCYVWTCFVRSQISDTGAWKEVYAGASQIVMPVTAEGVEFEKGVAEPALQGIDPADTKYALYMGRVLGGLFLEREIWGYPTSRITWEIDGKVTNAREYAYKALRLAREEEE